MRLFQHVSPLTRPSPNVLRARTFAIALGGSSPTGRLKLSLKSTSQYKIFASDVSGFETARTAPPPPSPSTLSNSASIAPVPDHSQVRKIPIHQVEFFENVLRDSETAGWCVSVKANTVGRASPGRASRFSMRTGILLHAASRKKGRDHVSVERARRDLSMILVCPFTTAARSHRLDSGR